MGCNAVCTLAFAHKLHQTYTVPQCVLRRAILATGHTGTFG
ncbi:hypothetical protein GBAR_LOCUS14396 [Geodia barretti]|uniref:Uncharacterized protein n=1 Tax=Geodia barretti TaxID=519541 RepID=A0AA35S9S2_GEOBA|nr:hypothetical protein GBAR_LOCUS14396 [Geodia barretti]